jgi:tetratricopeptide (TPR) repeat protein
MQINTIPPVVRRIIALVDRDPRRSTAVARRAVHAAPAGTPASMWLGYALGWALLGWERFDQARSAFQATLAAAPLPPIAARCRYGLLLTDFFQQLRAELLTEFHRAAAELTAVGATDEAAHAATFQAGLLNLLGRAGEAAAHLEQIKPLLATASEPARGRWCRVRAAAAYGQSDFVLATALLDEAVIWFTADRCRIEIAKCWYEQAALALRQHRAEEALDRYARADIVFAQLDLPYRRARCAQEQSIVLAQLGVYDEALERSARAMAYFSALGKTYDLARCHMQLGNIYWFTGCWDAALFCYRNAEQLYISLGVVAADLLTVRRNQALAYRALGQHNAAWTLLAELAEQARAFGDHAEAAEIAHEQAALLAGNGQVAEAMTRYEDAATRFTQLSNHHAAATSVVEHALLVLQSGQVLHTRQLLLDAAPVIAAQPHVRWRVEYGLARCTHMLGDEPSALAAYQAASATVSQLRGRLAGEMLSSTIFQQAEQLHRDALRLAVRLGNGEALLQLVDQQRALALRRHIGLRDIPFPHALQAEYNALVHQLHVQNQQTAEPASVQNALFAPLVALGELLMRAGPLLPQIGRAEWSPLPPLDLAFMRSEMASQSDSNWTALAYVVLDAELLIAVLTPDTVVVEKTPYDARLLFLLEHACGRPYRRYTYLDLSARQGQGTQPWKLLAELGERLLPPSVRVRLNNRHRLIVVPTGALHGLPWAALRLDNRWLIEQTLVQVAPSLGALVQLRALKHAEAAQALLLGCSEFQHRADYLPHVAEELATVAARLSGEYTMLLDRGATRAALLERAARGELRHINLLHVASHAQLLPSTAWAAHLMLHDGDLWMGEIGRLTLGGSLVVLSACDGASAKTLAGDETLSLSSAFLAGGARGVVASLWPLHDRTTVAIMEQFYAHLHTTGDAVIALANVQRAFANGEGAHIDGLTTTPYCWGSVIVIGDGRY